MTKEEALEVLQKAFDETYGKLIRQKFDMEMLQGEVE